MRADHRRIACLTCKHLDKPLGATAYCTKQEAAIVAAKSCPLRLWGEPRKRTLREYFVATMKVLRALMTRETPLARQRQAICATCSWNPHGHSCARCGCVIKLKTRLPDEACPEGYWGAVADSGTSLPVLGKSGGCGCGEKPA